LDLIDRKYIYLKNKSYSESYYPEHLVMEINYNNDVSSLWKFEVMVLDFLKKFEIDGIISMDLISESFENSLKPVLFNYDYGRMLNEYNSTLDEYEDWKNEVESTLLEGDNFKDAFHSNRAKYLKIFGILGMVTAEILFFYSFPSKLFSGIFILCALILFVVSIVSFTLPQRITGQWTPHGKEYYERWMSFKRYIEDFSLINEYSPEYVKIWNRYLVYATALGVAKEVKKEMWLSLYEEN
jgi:hypothetical protein